MGILRLSVPSTGISAGVSADVSAGVSALVSAGSKWRASTSGRWCQQSYHRNQYNHIELRLNQGSLVGKLPMYEHSYITKFDRSSVVEEEVAVAINIKTLRTLVALVAVAVGDSLRASSRNRPSIGPAIINQRI